MVKKLNTHSDRFKYSRHDALVQVLTEAAEAAIARKGYGRVTMRDIATEAGCVPGTLYLYFKSKRDVVDAILVKHSAIWRSLIMECTGSARDPVEKLREITQKSVDYFNGNRGFFKAAFAAAPVKPDKISADLPAPVRKDWQTLRKAILEVIRQAQAQKKIRRDFPAESIWKFMHGLFNGYFDGLNAGETLPDPREQMRMLWGFMSGGIGVREKRHARD